MQWGLEGNSRLLLGVAFVERAGSSLSGEVEWLVPAYHVATGETATPKVRLTNIYNTTEIISFTTSIQFNDKHSIQFNPISSSVLQRCSSEQSAKAFSTIADKTRVRNICFSVLSDKHMTGSIISPLPLQLSTPSHWNTADNFQHFHCESSWETSHTTIYAYFWSKAYNIAPSYFSQL